MAERKTYRTLLSPTTAEFVEKRSKFLAFAYPATNTEEIKHALEDVKKLHPLARHVCYAYRLGAKMDIYKAHDAGEPNNSAGQPILNQIKSFELTNVIVIVVRYFGGTKLGIPGLVMAYKEAAMLVLSAGEIIEDFEKERLHLQTTYEGHNALLNFLKGKNVSIADQEFGEFCDLYVLIAKEDFAIFVKSLDSLPFVKIYP